MKIAIIGAGSWGTALAFIVSKNYNLTWWVRREKLANQIRFKKRNTKYLAGCKLNTSKINISTNLRSTIINSELIIVAIPSNYIEPVFNGYGNLLKGKTILSTTKGVIPNLLIPPKKFFDNISNNIKYGVISGPCHAEEIAQKKISYLTISTETTEINKAYNKIFKTPFINVKTSSDVLGSEYASILKNIYAIMVGISSGLGYGDNFLAVLITACTNEMKRLLFYLDPKERVISKSAYLGDLLVTCYSIHSRNRKLGTAIGKGYSVENAISELTMVAEGYSATASIYKIIKKLKIQKEAPIVYNAYKVLYLDKEPNKVIKALADLIS